MTKKVVFLRTDTCITFLFETMPHFFTQVFLSQYLTLYLTAFTNYTFLQLKCG